MEPYGESNTTEIRDLFRAPRYSDRSERKEVVVSWSCHYEERRCYGKAILERKANREKTKEALETLTEVVYEQGDDNRIR